MSMTRKHRPPIHDLATHPREWIEVRELAEYLDVHERTIRRLIAAGALYAVRVGHQWRIPTAEASRSFPHAKPAA